MTDQRDKFVRTLTLRQKWPRNVDLNRKPHWFHIDTRSPFPSNVLYGRPRTIDRTMPAALEAGQEASPPWGKMLTHAALNNYVAENDIATPPTWGTMTIQQKKDWLDDR